MDAIHGLRTHIIASTDLRSQYVGILANEPDNFGAKLALSTLDNHIADLQHQLKKVLERRHKEILEVRLISNSMDGSIPLTIVSNLAKYISSAIHAGCQKVARGVDAKRRFAEDIIALLDLRLAGLAPGSTRLILTGNTAPDLFGNSSLETCFEKTFSLLSSNNTEEMTENVAIIGSRTAKEINKFLKVLGTQSISCELIWASPENQIMKWEADVVKIGSIINTLNKIHAIPPERINILGEVSMVSINGLFELNSSRMIFKGSFPNELLQKVKELHLGDTISASIEKTIIINELTRYEKISYSLIDFVRLDPTIDNQLTIL